jgi:hypothetical protein
MKAEVGQRTTAYALWAAAVLAYFSRPFSCGLVISKFQPDDPLSYAHFDNHGWLMLFAWLTTLIFAVPVLWLASIVFLKGSTKFEVFGWGPNRKVSLLSVAMALGLGTPMLSQLLYLGGLPISVTMPVLISSLVWLLVVEIGRTAAMKGDVLSKAAACIAAAVAFLPKLAFIGFVLF